MKALVLEKLEDGPVIRDRPEPKAGAGLAVVNLKAAALNRRDFWITQGLYPNMKLPVILGSDGAGIVTAIGEGVDAGLKGNEVVINPGYNWGERQDVQSGDFKILGMPGDGTFAGQIAVSAGQLYPKPAHLSWEEAAALPLAGLTAYRALFVQGGLKESQTVVVTGIGGGVAGMAMQFAIEAGAKVVVTSSSDEKISRAIKAGAAAGFNYTIDDYAGALKAEFDPVHFIIDGAAGDGFNKLIEIASPGGRIVNYGGTAGVPGKIEIRKVFWKQLHIIGSTMGSPENFAAMLEFVGRHKIKPIIDEVLPLSDGKKAFEKMAEKSQFGKLVLSISD